MSRAKQHLCALAPAELLELIPPDGLARGATLDIFIRPNQERANGAIRFLLEARWQRDDVPNWWSRAGFSMLSGYFQRRWHRRAHNLLSLLARYGFTARPPRDAAGLTHQGIDVTFTYHTKRKC